MPVTMLEGMDVPRQGRRIAVRALATLCVLLASGCGVVLGLEDHEVAGGASGSTGGGGGGGAGQGNGGGPVTPLVLTIGDDEDDCVWTIDHQGTGEHQERLAYVDDPYRRIFVSTDGDLERIGLRFPVKQLAGAKVLSAHLVLTYEAGNANGRRQVRIRVWDAADIPPFVGGHAHGPEGHASQGFWSQEVKWAPTDVQQAQTTPDLSALVQHVLDRPDFPGKSDPHAAFVIFPVTDGDTWFIGFQDSSSSSSDPPRLEVEYLTQD